MTELGFDGGWIESAKAWTAIVDAGDVNRMLLLDPVMLRLCGDVTGKVVLDVGCGEGRFCRMLSNRGGRTLGIDLISELIKTAVARHEHADSYAVATGDILPLRSNSFDLVISYLTLIDIDHFRAAIDEWARVLKPNGRLLVANLGFASACDLGWARDENGKRLYQRIDRYAEERPYTAAWSGMRIVNWHWPLSAYMQAFLGARLILRDFLEPVPEDQSLRDDDYTEDWFRVPLFNVMLWEKT